MDEESAYVIGLTTDITGPTAAGCWVRAREAGGVDGMVRRAHSLGPGVELLQKEMC